MRSRGDRWRLPHAAALLAVVLLTLATVRATVMQASAALPSAAGQTCRDAAAGHAGHTPEQHAAHAACEFCVAASVAPLACAGPALPVRAAVAWTPTPLRGVHGPRGPPAFPPRARGPPALLTA